MSRIDNKTTDIALEHDSPTRQLLRLALPIIGMMVSRMLMGFIDFVMVSQLGTAAQAAISPAVLLVFTFACVGMGLATSVQTFVSQSDGRGRPHLAGSYAWQSLYIAGIATLLACLASVSTPIWYEWIARLGKHTPEMTELEIAYTRIALWSVPLAVLSIGFDGFFMGIQKPRVALLAVVASLVVNASGNYVLIFGKLGFPELGIRGAAIATVIGWSVRVGILATAMLLPEFDRRYHTRRSQAWSSAKIAGMLRVGGPTAVQWLVDMGSWVVFLAVIMPAYGVHAAAASNVGLQYMHLSFMPAIGIGIALCSQVGFAIGKGDPDQAVARTRVAMRLTGVFMGTVGLLFILGGRPLMWLMNKDPNVIDAGVWVLVGAAIFQVFDAMCITHMSALRGAGDTRWPAVAIFLCSWVIFIGGGLAIGRLLPQLGLIGPWVMCTAYIIVLGLLLRWRWRAGKWRQIRLFKDTAADSAEPADELAAIARTASGKYSE